jgi:hypothetical protein
MPASCNKKVMELLEYAQENLLFACFSRNDPKIFLQLDATTVILSGKA